MTPRISRHSEAEVLFAFWAMVDAKQDRLDLVKDLASIAIRRPDDWSPLRIRQEFREHHPQGRPEQCFTCFNQDRPREWHHLLQIQHGGSNSPRNLVSVCVLCHSRIHPWLPNPESVALSGWSSTLELVRANYDWFDKAAGIGQKESA